MKKIIFVLTILFFITAGIKAESITVENFSFEEPGEAKIIGWDDGYYEATGEPAPDIPGWTSDDSVSSSGVESDWPGYTDGRWAGFIYSLDPSVHNLTDFVIPASIALSLKVDAQDNYSDFPPGLLEIALFYDDEGTRVTLDSKTVETVWYNEDGSSWVEYELTVAVDDIPDSIGQKIGIELDNVSAGVSWIGLDNIRLDTVYAYNPSPSNGATYVPADTNLSWGLADGFTCNVYFGTDPNVADNDMVIVDQDAEFYDPIEGKLDFDTTYYWRVDPIDPNDGSPYVITGSTWTFTTVPPTPIITAQPQDVVVNEGGIAVFTVEAYDPQGGTLDYQWYKFVDGINDKKLTGERDATLIITPVSVTDQGQYYCEVSNADPRPTLSDRANLLIKDIIGWWSFDSTLADPNNFDLSGNGNDVTIHGAATAEAGTALEFDGIDDYISVPVDVFSRLGDSQVTICLWQYGTGPQYTTIFQGVDDTDPPNRILNAHIPWGPEVFWDAGDDTGYDRIYKAAKESEYSGKWNHWTFTKNTDTGQMKMYLNGGLWQSGTDLTTPIGDIAVFNIAANAVPGEFYSGMLKDFRIYSYELTPEEIAQMFYDMTGVAPCMTPLAGDADGDCLVTVADIVLLATEWLDCGLYPSSECP